MPVWMRLAPVTGFRSLMSSKKKKPPSFPRRLTALTTFGCPLAASSCEKPPCRSGRLARASAQLLMQDLKYYFRPKCQGRAVSCRHDNATKRENRGKHLQDLKKFSITWRSGGRKMRCGPIVDLAMRERRRHPVPMIRLKPLPYPLLAVSVLSNIF